MSSLVRGDAALDAPLSASSDSPAWTPGPWEYVPGTEHHGPYVTPGADLCYGDIADCYAMSNPSAPSTRNGGDSKPINHQGERAEANARLIAAAPDLYAALAGLLGACRALANPGNGIAEICAQPGSWAYAADIALRKARGETPTGADQ